MMMLSDRHPILLANARIVDPSRDLDIVGDLLIAEGVIREAKKGIGAAGVPEGTDVIDCRGKLIAPGLIDMRAFIGEPGEANRETLASASQAAAAGGVTTIICQPDTSPAIDNPATVDFVLRRARDNAIVHVHPMAAITKGLEGKEMTEIGLLKAAGAVAFTDGAKSVTNAQVMRRALTYAGDFDAMIVHHTEDPNLIGDGVMNEGEFAARLGLLGIPKAAETVMLERDVRLVALSGGRYHAASVTCADTLEVLRRAKDAGLNVTASASINHVTLNENRYRPLSHLPQAGAATARGRRPQGAGRGCGHGTRRCGDVGSQSAGRRNQTPAFRRSGAGRNRSRDHAHRGLAPGP